jgi:hypothetical protein
MIMNKPDHRVFPNAIPRVDTTSVGLEGKRTKFSLSLFGRQFTTSEERKAFKIRRAREKRVLVSQKIAEELFQVKIDCEGGMGLTHSPRTVGLKYVGLGYRVYTRMWLEVDAKWEACREQGG